MPKGDEAGAKRGDQAGARKARAHRPGRALRATRPGRALGATRPGPSGANRPWPDPKGDEAGP